MTALVPAVSASFADSGSPGFAGFVRQAQQRGRLVVQPRMGFGDPAVMRDGLAAVRAARATTVGTVTLDSFTRVNRHDRAREALEQNHPLNGYPLVAHGTAVTREMLAGITGPDFPVQMRHGSALPLEIFLSMLAAGIDATEGGPVSYCLPYSRVPLRQAIAEWSTSAQLLADMSCRGRPIHLETFGGCMLGQLCPPSLLVALSVLEALFFTQRGVPSVSLSYAQQTQPAQDLEALRALHRLAAERLPGVDWHLVVYTFMGVYPPETPAATSLLEESVALAVHGGAARLIVKTTAEASRIPTVGENVAALEHAAVTAEGARLAAPPPGDDRGERATPDSGTYQEARALVEATLDLDPDIGEALALAFERGLLDVPYCLHRDNRNTSRSFIDDDGRLRWAEVGRMPIRPTASDSGSRRVGPTELLDMLHHNVRRVAVASGAARPELRS